jgi:hypothetical protein
VGWLKSSCKEPGLVAGAQHAHISHPVLLTNKATHTSDACITPSAPLTRPSLFVWPHPIFSLVQSGNRAFATADDDESDDEPAPASAKASAVRPSQAAAAGRGGGRGGAAGGKGPKDAATRQAEHRLTKLAEEAEVRKGVTKTGIGWVGIVEGKM